MPLKISNVSKHNSLTEVLQRLPLTFAYAKKEGEVVTQFTQPLKCRDYLPDTLLWKTGTEYNGPIYGYNYRGKELRYYPEFLLFDVRNPEGMAALNAEEAEWGAAPSVLEPTDQKDVYYISGDPLWYNNTVFLSYWSFLIRFILAEKEITQENWNFDMERLGFYPKERPKNIQEVTQKLCKLPKLTKTNPLKPQHHDGYGIHGPMGFVFYLQHPNFFLFGDK